MFHYRYLHRKSFFKDLRWLLAINALFFIIFAEYDVLEKMIGLVNKHEHWELDELLPLTITLMLSLIIFTYRRLAELGQITRAFEELAKQDPLTHILNRRAGQVILYNAHKLALSKGNGFSLLQLNIDNLKRINDLYGSIVGDDILIHLVKIIQQNLAVNDQLIHWHSDNFLLVLPSSTNSPYEFANNLRETIAQQLFTTDTITCSIGIALWRKGLSLQDMLHNVEDALLDAKAAGKNIVKLA